MSGLPGFDGRELDLAIGSVAGVRWWNLRMPDGPDGQPDLILEGVHSSQSWQPGENTARCINLYYPHAAPHEVPWEQCACGFWAYWEVPDEPNPHNFGIPVLGVIEGYGRTLIGDRGFRCARARITALRFTSDIATWKKEEAGYGPGYARFRTEAAVATWEQLCGRRDRMGYRCPDPATAMARLAALELQLQDRYGVPVYAAQSLMLAKHPPARGYLPPEKQVVPRRPTLTGAEALARMGLVPEAQQ